VISPVDFQSLFAFSPFSFLKGSLVVAQENLAGVDKNGSKIIQLPPLRENNLKRCLNQHTTASKSQVYFMRRPKSLEKRKKERSFWRNSTLYLPRLRSSFFKKVAILIVPFLFFARVQEHRVYSRESRA